VARNRWCMAQARASQYRKDRFISWNIKFKQLIINDNLYS
jgi:hypothetical protein